MSFSVESLDAQTALGESRRATERRRLKLADVMYAILGVVDNRKTILAPILPHTPVLRHRAQQMHEYLGYEGQPFGPASPGSARDRQGRLFGRQHVVKHQEATRSHNALTYDHSGAIGAWAPGELPPGQSLRQPAPLFKKLDEGLIEEEYARPEG